MNVIIIYWLNVILHNACMNLLNIIDEGNPILMVFIVCSKLINTSNKQWTSWTTKFVLPIFLSQVTEAYRRRNVLIYNLFDRRLWVILFAIEFEWRTSQDVFPSKF